MTYHFRWTCSGMGETDYAVSGAGAIKHLRVRYDAGDYFKSISSYSDLDWEREVVASLGLLRSDACGSGQEMPQDLVDAFNAWRLAEYEASRAKILGDYARYGIKPEDYANAISAPPSVLRGAVGEHHWVAPEAPEKWHHGSVWAGWRVNGETAAERLARLELTHRSYAEKHARYIEERCNGKRDQADVDRALAEYRLAARLLLEAQCEGAPPVRIVGDAFTVDRKLQLWSEGMLEG